MADKKLVEAITSMEEDFAQWYTDVVKKAELIDYTSVKGCMVIRPAGYAIWELIQKQLDDMFKETGVQNAYLPMFIPQSSIRREIHKLTLFIADQSDRFLKRIDSLHMAAYDTLHSVQRIFNLPLFRPLFRFNY